VKLPGAVEWDGSIAEVAKHEPGGYLRRSEVCDGKRGLLCFGLLRIEDPSREGKWKQSSEKQSRQAQGARMSQRHDRRIP
jgi:hypothetical protein